MTEQDTQLFAELETLQVLFDGLKTRQSLTDAERLFVAEKMTHATAGVLDAALMTDDFDDVQREALDRVCNATRQSERSLERTRHTLAPTSDDKDA